MPVLTGSWSDEDFVVHVPRELRGSVRRVVVPASVRCDSHYTNTGKLSISIPSSTYPNAQQWRVVLEGGVLTITPPVQHSGGSVTIISGNARVGSVIGHIGTRIGPSQPSEPVMLILPPGVEIVQR